MRSGFNMFISGLYPVDALLRSAMSRSGTPGTNGRPGWLCAGMPSPILQACTDTLHVCLFCLGRSCFPKALRSIRKSVIPIQVPCARVSADAVPFPEAKQQQDVQKGWGERPCASLKHHAWCPCCALHPANLGRAGIPSLLHPSSADDPRALWFSADVRRPSSSSILSIPSPGISVEKPLRGLGSWTSLPPN
jgi:hypothetical protein